MIPRSRSKPSAEFWRGRAVLVTGASGLLGGWTVRRLSELGAAVTGLARGSGGARFPNGDESQAHRRVLAVDVRDRSGVEAAVREVRPDLVLHLAAQTLGGTAFADPVGTFETNVAGTWHVLDACRRADPTPAVIVASSYNAYGEDAEVPYREDMPLRGTHPYDASKACADLLGSAYARSFGLRVGITRCGNLYGGGETDWKYIVPGTIRSILSGEPPLIRSHGRFVRDYVYVEDAVEAHLVLAERLDTSGSCSGEAFNVCGGAPLSVVELVRRIARVLDSDLEPVLLGEPVDEPIEKYASPEKASRELGWFPRVGLEEGLARTASWYAARLGAESIA